MPVELLTWIAADENGRRIRAHLEESGVRIHPASFAAPATPIADASIGVDGHADYHFELGWAIPAIPLGDDVGLVHGGSIGAFMEPGASSLIEIAAAAKAGGRMFTLDPNVRPEMMGRQVDGLERFERLASLARVVKLSDQDAKWLYPGLRLSEVTEHLHALGVGLAVMTLGAHGSVLSSETGTVRSPAVPTVVVDTVGAGDTYMAALISGIAGYRGDPGLLEEKRLAAIGAFCSEAAAITVGRSGADLPRMVDIHAAVESSPLKAAPGHVPFH